MQKRLDMERNNRFLAIVVIRTLDPDRASGYEASYLSGCATAIR